MTRPLKSDLATTITGIAAAFDARFPVHCTEMQRGIAKGFYAALHAVALSFGLEWSEAKLMAWIERQEEKRCQK